MILFLSTINFSQSFDVIPSRNPYLTKLSSQKSENEINRPSSERKIQPLLGDVIKVVEYENEDTSSERERFKKRNIPVQKQVCSTIAKNNSLPPEREKFRQSICDVIKLVEDDPLNDEKSKINGENKVTNSTIEQTAESVKESFIDMILYRLDSSKMKNFILNKRSYAKSEPFERKNLGVPPVLEDMLPDPPKPEDSFYLSWPAFTLIYFGATAVFPFFAEFLEAFVDMPATELDDITSKFVPGVSILYGTYISLTLSILYNRQKEVQESVAKETSLLSFLLHNFITLFTNEPSRMVEAAQCVADQVRILLKESRGLEYMAIVYTDPYMKMMRLVSSEEVRMVEEHGDFLSKGVSISNSRWD